MDLLGGALPNVMFIIGILAIGLGLGIELKLVPLNKEIDKTGRVGAIVVGTLLVVASVFIYLNPGLVNRNQASSTTTNAALAPAATQATSAPAQVSAPTATVVPTEAPTATPVPSAIPTEAPTAMPAPTAVPPTATPVPGVLVPNLHDMDEKAAQRKLKDAGLAAKKVDACSGTDQGDQKVRKGHVVCQNPAPDQPVAPGSTVEYVLAGK
ncbi:MAG TPA: PASTA domain-containing protein [Roseiflexaceae bacterium]|nr:PASTA domain-containing protein [Roseiflexaceae bacterium]